MHTDHMLLMAFCLYTVSHYLWPMVSPVIILQFSQPTFKRGLI